MVNGSMWTRRHFLGTTCASTAVAALSTAWVAEATPDKPQHESETLEPIDAARGVLHRNLGARAADFQLSLLAKDRTGHETYEIESVGGTVRIAGDECCRAMSRSVQLSARTMWRDDYLER